MKIATKNNIEELLLESEKVVAVHHYKHKPIPTIDTSLWRSERKAKETIKSIIDYIEAPCIEDTFGSDHTSRRLWKDNIVSDKEIKAVLENDPLRANVYNSIFCEVEILKRGYKGPNKEKFEEMSWFLEDFPQNYNNLSFKEKLKVVNKIKTRVYNILLFLSSQGNRSKKTK